MSTSETTSRPIQSARAGSGPVAIAYPNMALVKYWGKRDESLILPVTSSLSMTLDIFPTTTRVTLRPKAAVDTVTLNGRRVPPQTRVRVERFLDLVRDMAGRAEPARVETNNTVPTGAGLASSASGFAALAAAATAAYGVELDARALSRLARRGSGSACRSIFGGFVTWHAGTGFGAAGDESCYAEPIECALDVALVVAIVDAEPKALPSRTAMRHSVATSPFYLPWATASRTDLEQVHAALAAGDLERAGQIAEHNALGMHAVLLAARPAIRYLAPRSLRVLDRIERLRADGISAYATIDAGPNVAVLCARHDAARVVVALRELDATMAIRIAHPGPGVTVTGGDQR
ncbi:diphosphomevalonate decarboxylase [Nocardia sp. N2S4-5]|uniref:diphosphomevalonate decarboxylase n=1 Tax=Nocardia sp. N2S4-5 TaxID=3351565 RepID=UPI0037D51937